MGLPFSKEFLKGMDEGVMVVNRNRQITLWNQKAEAITGFSEVEMLGKTCAKQVRCHFDDGGEPLCDDFCPLKAALISGKPQELRAKLRRKDGQMIDVNLRVVPYHNAQGFIEGAIERITTIEEPNWEQTAVALEGRITYTDVETGMLNRNFLDTYYIGMIKRERAHYERGLILIDVDMLGEFGHLKDKMKAYEIRRRLSEMLVDIVAKDSEMVAARWSAQSFVLLINNSHPVHLQDTVIFLEKRIREVLYERDAAGIDLCFRLMSTLISSDEPLEKVVDILHKKSARTYRVKDFTV